MGLSVPTDEFRHNPKKMTKYYWKNNERNKREMHMC